MPGDFKRRAVDELRGEIELKENVVKTYQEMFAKSLKNGFGEEIKNTLSEAEKKPKETRWSKLKKNLLKILK